MSDSGGAVSRLDKPQAPADPPLRKNVNFQLLWAGSVPAFLGREIVGLVYPLVVLAITGSPGWAGAFGGVQIFASLVCGMPAGALADRYDQRRLLLLVETARSLATSSVAAAYFLHELTLIHLLLVAVVLGAVQPVGGSTRMLLVRSLVPGRQLTAALTQEEVRSEAAAMAGPPLGGFLYAVASGLPFLVAAGGFAVAAGCTFFVRPPARTAGAEAAGGARRPQQDELPLLRRMLVGLHVLWRRPLLRSGMLFGAAMNTVGAPIILVVVVQLRDQGVGSGTLGLATIGMGVGGLAGALLVKPLHRMLAPGVLLLSVGAVEAVLIALLALGRGPWWVAGLLFLMGLNGPSVRVLVDILIFRQVPDEQRGRAVAACMTVFGAGSSLGVLVGGQLLQHLSPATAVLVLAACEAVAVGIGLGARSLRKAVWPEDMHV
ncbi:MFS transporter [Streptomyces sp. NPDC058231]|uniref:MFS transporter n=1 Tax=Streptomyces sp. NPDC058231 TaxID=3346392 RepID=UPI0036E91B44